MDIREARPADNAKLQELQADCSQGTDLIVSVVNTPDFFARAKAYESCKVFVACEGVRIIGSAACVIRNGVVSGETRRVGYWFQAFVAPDHRRKGVASRLHQYREDYATQQGAVLFYTLIMEDNTPAIRYIEDRGFRLHRTLVMPGLRVYKEMDMPAGAKIRLARSEDLVTVAELLNETWQGFELYEPTSAKGLAKFISRTPGYGLENLLVLEDGGEILACLGYWDWSQIMRLTVIALSSKMRTMGLLLRIASIFKPVLRSIKPIKPGDTMKQVMLTCIGFKDPAYLSVLLRHVNNQAFQRGIEQIFCICERNHVMLKSLKGFLRIDTAVNLYVKTPQEKGLIADKPVFVDGIDM